MKQYWILESDDAETVQRIDACGGKTLRTKTKIEADGMGYFALFSDSEGNTLGLYSEN